ncbi:hypothetical protein CDIK_0763, partial [Cucumispora dikerogammari]
MLLSAHYLNIKQMFCSHSNSDSPNNPSSETDKQIDDKTFEYDYNPFIKVTHTLINHFSDFNSKYTVNLITVFEKDFLNIQNDSKHYSFLHLVKKIDA